MTYKVRDLIRGSLRLIGALAPGEAPSAAELADGVVTLNQMASSWSLETLMIPAKVREDFTLISGQGRYSMGPGGDFDTTRPVRIENALLQLDGSVPFSELALDIITKEQWAAIPVKNLRSSLPTELYAEGTSPLEYINIWPIPDQARSIAIYSAKPLGAFTADTVLSLPPGYEKALRYNLAIELAPEFGRSVTAEVVAGAQESKSLIKTQNSKPMYLSVDSALLPSRGGFNYIKGE
jgi:hypothetical protein